MSPTKKLLGFVSLLACASLLGSPATDLQLPSGVDRDLAKQADRLGITPGELRSARQVLRKATETIAAIPADQFSSQEFLAIGLNWARLDPENKEAVARFLVEQFRRQVAGASTGSQYASATLFAFRLFSQFPALDAEWLYDKLAHWPPAPDGTPALEHGDLVDQAVDGYLRGIALRDAGRARQEFRALRQLFPKLETTFEIQILIARELVRQNLQPDVTGEIQNCFAEFRTAPASPAAIVNFRRALYFVARLQSPLFVEGFQLLAEKVGSLSPETTLPTCVAGKGLAVTGRDSQLLEALSYVRGRHDLTQQAVEGRPRIQALVTEIEDSRQLTREREAASVEMASEYRVKPPSWSGGVGDPAASPWPFPISTQNLSSSISIGGPPVLASPRSLGPGYGWSGLWRLQREKEVGKLKERLWSRFNNVDGFDDLLYLGRFAALPEIWSEAITIAEQLIEKAPGISDQMEMTAKLLPVRRVALGKADAARLEAARRLLDQARTSQPAPGKTAEAAKDLEHALLIEQAFVNLDVALSEVDAAGTEARLPLLLDMIAALSHQPDRH